MEEPVHTPGAACCRGLQTALRVAMAVLMMLASTQPGVAGLQQGPPFLDTSHPALLFESSCVAYSRVCFDQGSVVSFDGTHSPANRTSRPLPQLDISGLAYNWGGAPQSDRLRFSRFFYHPLTLRPAAGELEGSPDLRQPLTFSRRTVPLVVWSTWPHNMAEFFAHVPARLWALQQDGALGAGMTLVVGTPPGERLPAFVPFFLKPFSPSYEVVSFAQFSERHPPANAPRTSAEGTPQRCFQSAYLCAFSYGFYAGAYGAAQAVVRHYQPQLPPAPVQFDGGEEVLKVLIERRRGGVRNLLNSQQVVEQCNEAASWQGGLARGGNITRVQCRQFTFTGDPLANLAAVRAADVLVIVHGAGCTNWLFMQEGGAMLEIRPHQFGSLAKAWVENQFPAIGEGIQHKVHHYGLNIEDPELYRPSQLEKEHPVPPENRRYQMDLRDRHVRLPFEALREMLLRIAAAGRSRSTYLQQRGRGEALVELLPGGVLRTAKPLPASLKGPARSAIPAAGTTQDSRDTSSAAAAWVTSVAPPAGYAGAALVLAVAAALVWRWQRGAHPMRAAHSS